ncbi:glycosyltransferase family 4 protein [Leptolyngbya ohadii]|uniref:glycosyltransferase family 4 protein n=1 Tax=Leptolyngbya ohadii TaxID=1962290 RepID=UPI000B59AB85|nr:glycosyltransferase family 4 protein [Leptolyngbya ohadii]
MKVWIITMAFPYPSETFACNDVSALRRAGIEVVVHGLRPEHPHFTQLVAERGVSDIWITHNSIKNTLDGLRVALQYPRLLLNFIAWILRHSWKRPANLFKSLILVPRSLQIFDLALQDPPEIIYLYWSHFPSLVGYLIQARLPQIAVSISFVAHDVYYPEFNSKDSYTGSVARQADVVQTITAANIPAIEKFGIAKDNIALSYHGIDLSRIPSAERKIGRRIVTAGRLIPEKGFDQVLEVFKQVLEVWSDASLVVLGDGPERENLEHLACTLNIRHAVDFRGFVSHDEIFQAMAIAEVFLFMSFYQAERLSNVVKEAIGCRCLCVVSHTPGIEELIHDRVEGYIVQSGDLEGAAKRIHQVFSDPEQRIEMTEKAYQRLQDHFDLDQIIQKMQQNWQQALTKKQTQT